MFHEAEFDRLLSDLKKVQKAVRCAPLALPFVNRVDAAVGDFEHQPTIWDAYEGRNRSQGWELPDDFATRFEAWTAAYRRLANVDPQIPKDLEGAVAGAAAVSDAILAELYRCKDERAGRLALALDLFAASEEIVRQNLRRQHPDASPERIERDVDEWLRRRPGAESGDGWGRPVTWPRTMS